MRFEHSIDLPQLLAGALDALCLSQQELRRGLQSSWHELADRAAAGRLKIRGKRDGEGQECDLSVNDLRNCRTLAWTKLGQTSRRGWLRDSDDRRQTVMRVERDPDTYEGAWDRLGDTAGDDYYDVFVLRSELMNEYPVSKPSVRRMRAVGEAKQAATRWLASFCEGNPPKVKTKPQIISEMRQHFELPRRTADAIWVQVTETRPEWRAPGRPRKNPPEKSPAT